jgi:Protein of unknown function (DUF1598)
MTHVHTAAQPIVKSPGRAHDTICLSISMLIERARLGSYRSRDSAASETCGGLNFVKGYVLDEASHDVIIYGNSVPNRPPILFDDLCVCVQNVWHAERVHYVDQQYPFPFCSLDPRKGAMASVELAMRDVNPSRLEKDGERRQMIQMLSEALGPQEVRVGGVPKNVRLAQVMVDADYHMKKVSQGHVAFPGVKSCLHIGLDRQKHQSGLLASLGRIFSIKHSPQGSHMSRFWFHLEKDHPTFTSTSGIVEIDQCAMVVLTERQLSARDGSVVDGGGDDPGAQAFAKSMSTQLRKGATCFREYADLENLYRLFALLKAIQYANAEKSVGLNLQPLMNYPPRRIAIPEALPALANIEVEVEQTPNAKHWYCSLVCGGVSMEVSLARAAFGARRDKRLEKTKSWIIRSRPDRRSLFWVARPVF